MPTSDQIDSVRNRLEQVATVGARLLGAGDDHDFIGYAVRVVDQCLAELGPPAPARPQWPGYQRPAPAPPYDWSQDTGG